MKLTIEIKMDNAAFDNDDGNGTNGIEVARIIRELGDELDERTLDAGFRTGIYDANGNRVGEARVA